MQLRDRLAPLGFGFMRLPEQEGPDGQLAIDQDTVNAMA